LKVIHIAPTPFFSNRGCHIRIRNEIEGLQQNGIKVILCTYHHGNNVPGLDVRRIRAIPGYTKTSAGYSPFKFVADILLFFLVFKTVWRERPVLIHGHLHEGALLGWLVSIFLYWRRIPVVMDMQGSLSGELKAYGVFTSFPLLLRFFLVIEKIICRLPHFIVCSSLGSISFLRRKCKIEDNKSSMLQDVVPEKFFQTHDKSYWRRTYRIPEDKSVVIYTGSFLTGKGIEHLLESMKLLLSKRKDLFFIYLGYPEEPVLEFVRKHGLTNNSMVVGEVSYDELSGWLSVADVAVEPKMADSGEASGKVLHYMASALPVVCFDLINNRNFLADNGFYAEPGSVSSLAAAIEMAVADPVKAAQKAKNGRIKLENDYSLASVGLKLAELYDKLLK
jgi:glycosyltransferase involved in cell wall biosynthesis